jgi:hypothetical protein
MAGYADHAAPAERVRQCVGWAKPTGRANARPMRVPTIRREDVRYKDGGHGAKSAFVRPTDYGLHRLEIQKVSGMPQFAGPGERALFDKALQVAGGGGA